MRIARAARAAGIAPLGIYSEADRSALYLESMDGAAFVGPAAAPQSYLNSARILAAARALGADAIHPGYGFLSEQAAFAHAVADAGMTFVGPPPSAIAAAGDKSEAKRRARACGIAVVPGYDGEDQAPAELRRQAERIGLPLLIKARAGGGGRGMRVVTDLRDFEAALGAAQREAQLGFGDDRVLLERYLARPRHIEFQILADSHGGTIHLGERDCSVQRRHQKLIEEAPSPALTPVQRADMGAAAVRFAQSIGYVNAGTVEFLLDAEGAFYFLEMNPRLQVEHAVTEEVYGLDLVRWQLHIAAGEWLAIAQDRVTPRGWSIEARINAEDPAGGYLPATGTIEEWIAPEADGIRVESGVRAGSEISVDYDSLLAKVIATAPSRDDAIERLRSALAALYVRGISTNVPLLLKILRDPEFTAGTATTALLEEHALMQDDPGAEPDAAFLIALGAALRDERTWRIAGVGIPITLRGQRRTVSVIASRTAGANGWHIAGDLSTTIPLLSPSDARVDAGGIGLSYAGERYRFLFGHPPAPAGDSRDGRTAGRGRVVAPMPGTVSQVAVRTGDAVRERDLLVVLEAMKMEHRIEAAHGGVIRAVHIAPGARVAKDALLVEFE